MIATCKDELPTKMASNKNCKKLKKTCPALRRKCRKALGSTLGSSKTAKRCKTALGSAQNSKVRSYCKKTCNYECGKTSFFNC